MSSRWIIAERPLIAQHRLDLARPPADDLSRVVEIEGDQPAPDLAAVCAQDNHRVAA